jgi:signal transduction histidine kinase
VSSRAKLADGTGMGLAGLRERAALLGGTLHAGPRGEGWTVKLEIPR